MAKLLTGKEVAASINEKITKALAKLEENSINPTLAILRVGARAADISYETGVVKKYAKLGIGVRKFVLPENCTDGELLKKIQKINEDESIHGCLMFRPLPKQLNEQAACAALKPEKDVDGITEESLESVFANTKRGFKPGTAQACLEILKYYGYALKGKNVVVVGRSLVIGKPVAMLLLSQNATITICHSHSKDMAKICQSADILIVAVGKAGLVKANYTNDKQVIIDVGINVNAEGKLCGDVDFAEVEHKVSAITPVPGGVGMVTTSVLAEHVVEAAAKQQEIIL